MDIKQQEVLVSDVSYNNFTGSAPTSCQQSNANLVASYSSAKNNEVNWCLMKDLPCSTKPQYHSLFINCGGNQMSFKGNVYEEHTISQGPSIFFASGQKWAYSSTGTYQFDGTANFVTQTSDPNVSGIFQTARLAPLSLKYYGLCMQRGSYTVKLHFAEIMFTDDQTFSSNGRRIFDVSIQVNQETSRNFILRFIFKMSSIRKNPTSDVFITEKCDFLRC